MMVAQPRMLRPLLATLLGTSLVACTQETASSSGPPDLVIFLAPGLRADGPGTSSGEAALAKALGETPTHRYAAAYAQTPSPRVSLGSLLTGLYPSAIPLCGRYVPREYDLRDRGTQEQAWCADLPAEHPTWPAVLSLYDYKTALIRGSAYGTDHIDTAFDKLIPLVHEPPDWQTSWREVVQAAQTFWKAESNHPKLLVVIASDLELPALSRFFEEAGLASEQPGDKGAIAHPEILRERYKEVASQVGAGMKSVLDGLPDGPRERWVVVTSTHGVSLGERAAPADQARALAYDHLKLPTTQILLDRTVHVPLLFYGPGKGPGHVKKPVELLDLFPTLAALGGATKPARLQGDDLFASAADDNPVSYAEFGDMLALRDGEHLLTFRCYLHNGTSLDPELTHRFEAASLTGEFFSLHNIQSDPMQQMNLQDQDLPRLQSMRNDLLAQRKGPGAPPPEALGAEQLKALRLTPALGYW